MKTRESAEKKNSQALDESLAFDSYTIRLAIGVIAMLFPVVVALRASGFPDSISWSYYTDARDFYVGFLFVIGGYLISYQGHRPPLDQIHVGKFWNWVNSFWKGAIDFRKRERKYEEDLVTWVGGVAAAITALFPTAYCLGADCPRDPISVIHYIAAALVFGTTVFFCLVAFRSRAVDKLKRAEKLPGKTGAAPRRWRLRFYAVCGWGIAVVMIGVVVLKATSFQPTSNIMFWAETIALELFGIAWLIASQYLPGVTTEAERRSLFSDQPLAGEKK
jgi:hypothetical protein